MPNSIHFLITFEVKPNATIAFETMLTALKMELPNVEGCQSLRIFKHDEEAQSVFTLLETWDEKSLHQAHLTHLQDAGDWEKIEAMLVVAPTGQYLQAF